MCFACEKIYGEDYVCRSCSVQRKTNVYMEVAAPGMVRCVLCGQEHDAPGLNLETSMKRESIARLRRTLSSIPPRTSTGPNRVPGVSTIGGHRIRGLDENSQGSPGAFRPHVQKRATAPSQRIMQFPVRPEPDLIASDMGLTVVVEFPCHQNENEIVWHIVQETLAVESKIEGCPYRNEIKLPEWAREADSVRFQNGILEFVFVRKPQA